MLHQPVSDQYLLNSLLDIAAIKRSSRCSFSIASHSFLSNRTLFTFLKRFKQQSSKGLIQTQKKKLVKSGFFERVSKAYSKATAKSKVFDTIKLLFILQQFQGLKDSKAREILTEFGRKFRVEISDANDKFLHFSSICIPWCFLLPFCLLLLGVRPNN